MTALYVAAISNFGTRSWLFFFSCYWMSVSLTSKKKVILWIGISYWNEDGKPSCSSELPIWPWHCSVLRTAVDHVLFFIFWHIVPLRLLFFLPRYDNEEIYWTASMDTIKMILVSADNLDDLSRLLVTVQVALNGLLEPFSSFIRNFSLRAKFCRVTSLWVSR